MPTTKKIPTAADISAVLPALNAIAKTSPFGFARVTHSEEGAPGGPSIRVELPAPCTGMFPITVAGHVAYGSTWKVQTSGGSWRIESIDDLRTTAAVLAVAQSLHALLASLA